MRWRLYIEEFSPELTYLKGEDNQAADALSRLPRSEQMTTQQSTQTIDSFQMDPAKALAKLHTNDIPTSMEQYSMEECAALFHQEEDPDWNPVTYNHILDNQKTDPQQK